MAVSAVMSGGFAYEIIHRGSSLANLKYHVIVFVVLAIVILHAPLLVFTPRLARCRIRGLLDFGTLIGTHDRAFDEKWVKAEGANQGSCWAAPMWPSLAESRKSSSMWIGCSSSRSTRRRWSCCSVRLDPDGSLARHHGRSERDRVDAGQGHGLTGLCHCVIQMPPLSDNELGGLLVVSIPGSEQAETTRPMHNEVASSGTHAPVPTDSARFALLPGLARTGRRALRDRAIDRCAQGRRVPRGGAHLARPRTPWSDHAGVELARLGSGVRGGLRRACPRPAGRWL